MPMRWTKTVMMVFGCAGWSVAARAEEGRMPAEAVPDASTLAAQGQAAYGAKEYARCIELLEAAARTAAPTTSRSSYLYSAASCHALKNDPEGAFQQLRGAVEAGYQDIEHLRQDPDLAGLRSDARWPALLVDVEARRAASLKMLTAELHRLFDEDQTDRQGALEHIDWSKVMERDEQRRRRVTEIMQAGAATTALDYFQAATIMQHGSAAPDFDAAHQWAVHAVELDPSHNAAKWLAAASQDRYLMQLGKPQRYGTQLRKVDGRWSLYRVDTRITDEERARWNVPPLAVAKKRAEEMNTTASK
jgi:hypothetical protein